MAKRPTPKFEINQWVVARNTMFVAPYPGTITKIRWNKERKIWEYVVSTPSGWQRVDETDVTVADPSAVLTSAIVTWNEENRRPCSLGQVKTCVVGDNVTDLSM